MIYEALKVQACSKDVEFKERLHPGCAKRRGAALIFGVWRWKVNGQDLKFQCASVKFGLELSQADLSRISAAGRSLA